MFNDFEIIEKILLPHANYFKEQWNFAGSTTGLSFNSLSLGRFLNGKRLKKGEASRLASFAYYIGADDEENFSFYKKQNGINLFDFGESEYKLSRQLRIYKALSKEFEGRLNLRIHLNLEKSNNSFYAYVWPTKIWFRYISESDFKKGKFGYTIEQKKHILKCAQNLPGNFAVLFEDDRP